MAKYSRFDPRNKNRGRNKQRSMERDIRIREVDDNKYKHQAFLREVVYDDEYDDVDQYDEQYLTESNT